MRAAATLRAVPYVGHVACGAAIELFESEAQVLEALGSEESLDHG